MKEYMKKYMLKDGVKEQAANTSKIRRERLKLNKTTV